MLASQTTAKAPAGPVVAPKQVSAEHLSLMISSPEREAAEGMAAAFEDRHGWALGAYVSYPTTPDLDGRSMAWMRAYVRARVDCFRRSSEVWGTANNSMQGLKLLIGAFLAATSIPQMLGLDQKLWGIITLAMSFAVGILMYIHTSIWRVEAKTLYYTVAWRLYLQLWNEIAVGRIATEEATLNELRIINDTLAKLCTQPPGSSADVQGNSMVGIANVQRAAPPKAHDAAGATPLSPAMTSLFGPSPATPPQQPSVKSPAAK